MTPYNFRDDLVIHSAEIREVIFDFVKGFRVGDNQVSRIPGVYYCFLSINKFFFL